MFKMDGTYIRLLFAEKRYEVVVILASLRRQQMEKYLHDEHLETWKCDMIKQFLK